MWKWWYQRLAKRATDSGWTFMNYGYISKNDNYSLDLKSEDESNRLFIQLYNYASSQIPVDNRKILDAAGGAIVSNIGYGREEGAEAIK